jgi:hypothetical protein
MLLVYKGSHFPEKKDITIEMFFCCEQDWRPQGVPLPVACFVFSAILLKFVPAQGE